METALGVLESVRREGEALGGKRSNMLARGWCAWTKKPSNHMKIGGLETGLKKVRDVAEDDLGGLKERVMAKGF